MATAAERSAGGRTEANETEIHGRTNGALDHGLADDSLRISIPEDFPGRIRKSIEENGPGMFRSVEVGLQDNDRFLLISVELSPAATRRGLRTTQTADLLRDIMTSYSPSPVPSNRWICEIALPDTPDPAQPGGAGRAN